jgi:hypothetical protein
VWLHRAQHHSIGPNKLEKDKPMKYIALIMAFTFAALAQQHSDTLNVDGVVKMVNAGLSDDLIIARLQKDGKVYDLSPDDMVKLKAERVSDNVIKAMLDPHAAITTPPSYPWASSLPKPSGATPAPGVAANNPNDPLSAHDSGIYLYATDREGKPLMKLLERTDYQGSKTGGMLGAR